MSALLVYIAVVVTVVAIWMGRAIGGLRILTRPKLGLSHFYQATVEGVVGDPRDWGVRACCVHLVSPLSLQLVDVSYTVQVGGHDRTYAALTRDQAVALLRDRGIDDRTFVIPDLEPGAYFHPGQDVWIVALAMPLARELHRFDVVLGMVDAGGRIVRTTANTLTRRLPAPIDATEQQSVG